jgi:hypothetical protein
MSLEHMRLKRYQPAGCMSRGWKSSPATNETPAMIVSSQKIHLYVVAAARNEPDNGPMIGPPNAAIR